MLKLKSLTKLAAMLAVILFTVAVSAAPASQGAATIKTSLQPDLSLKSVLSTPFASSATGGSMVAAIGRTCKCSCGFPCKTDADCGPGGVCAAGITCCNATPRKDKDDLSSVFQKREALSSRQTPSTIKFNVDCNQK